MVEDLFKNSCKNLKILLTIDDLTPMTEIVVKNNVLSSNVLQEVNSGDAFEYFLQSQKKTSLKDGLSDAEAYNLRASTTDILNHCNPHDAFHNPEVTHLVVGYVQSGKTMSFTGVLAMARDNGYRVAIILTGITTNLQDQTSTRLAKDLNNDLDTHCFSILNNPSKEESGSIIKALRLSDRPLLIIPVLKHKKYINDLAKIFRDTKVINEMKSETVLIIDDEADQASLNSFGYKNSKTTEEDEKQESATYASILRLRTALPGNSYIQYTATPQANLLITTMDLLSPKTHTLLIPGERYIGGKKFFGLDKDHQLYGGKLVIEIPPEEVFHKKENVLTEIPKSLKEAMIMHVWAVILVIKWYKRKKINQLAMMVHPTDIIKGNKLFETWIRDELDYWSDSFTKPSWDQNHVLLLELFESYFPSAIQFYPKEGRPTFDDVSKYIPDVINDCRVYRITGDSSDDSTKIDWNAHCMNILIGAQMLNRGFTVEKLATTYMPRYTTGITNADTIEQRCRFFGYKMDYIESCRVYLPSKSIEDYNDYVHHEDELRSLLSKCSSLKDYEHSIMLSPQLRPTRQNVLPKQMVKTRLVNWNKYERMSGVKMLIENKLIVESFVNEHLSSSHDFKLRNYDSNKYYDGEIKKHSLKDMSFEEVMPLLSDFKAGNFKDTVTKSITLRFLSYLADNNNERFKVIFMSKNQIRERGKIDIDDDLWRVELFQGRSNLGERDDYIGDTNIYFKDNVTIQIHHINITGLSVSESQYNETYAIAIHFPERLATYYNTTI